MRAALWHCPPGVLVKGTNAMICSSDHIVTYLIISFVSVGQAKYDQTWIKLFRHKLALRV